MTTPIYRLLPAVAAWWVVSRVTCANYDEFMTCGSGSERYGRHYRYNPNLPCDLSKDGFCDSPGTQYPWSAVRRFVYENQGLMKRMYGNQRHYNVLRSEVINEMYEEMFEEMPKRQHNRYQQPPHPAPSTSSFPSQPENTRTPRYHKNSNANSLKTKSWTKSSKTSGSAPSRHQKSRSMKVTAEPEYRQRTPTLPPSTSPKPKTQSGSTGNKNRIKEATATTPFLESKGSSVATDIPVNKATRTNTRRPQSSTNFASSEPLTSSADTPLITTENEWGSEEHLTDDFSPVQKMEEGEGFEENVQSTYFPPHNLDDINIFDDEEFWTTLEDFDSTTPYSTLDSVDSDNTYSTLPQQEMVTSTPSTLESDVFLEDPDHEEYFKDFISSPSDEGDVTTLTAPDEIVADQNTEESNPENPDEMDMVFEESITQEEIRQQEVAESLSLDSPGAMAEATEEKQEDKELEPEMREEVSAGVVHKDVLEDFHEQEPEKETVKIKRPIRGMNACPVKEEFVAPYWANNTRGETLALLNFYPFEQYVQWERCMYEHRQMYCRKGCRCEQQYRLQKLLAFDPTNECRGIFSDWFRFPSCCVCKCYDLPQDIFTGSARRPRIQPDDYDEEDFYDDEEEEVDLQDFEEDDYEDDGNENHDDIEHSNDREEEEIPLSTLSYRVRSQGGRYVNIPPQRRPRLPPRPASHINLPHNYIAFKDKEASSSSSTPPSVHTSTLGTLDVSTPHYFFNISHFAQRLLGNSQPFPLSRIPRSNPDV